MTYPLNPGYAQLPDGDIIERCQQGDMEAFNVLICRYEDRVVNLALRYLRDYHQAVDVAQEVFLKLLTKIKQYKGQSAFGTWLYRVTTNQCFNVLKQRRQILHDPAKNLSLDVAREGGYHETLRDTKAQPPDEAYAQQRLREQIGALLGELPPKYQQVIVLAHFEQLTYSEIAGILDVPETTVRSCLHRARQRLKTLFEQKGGMAS